MIYPSETVVNKTVVKVLNTQVSVTSGCLDLKDTFPCIGDGMCWQALRVGGFWGAIRRHDKWEGLLLGDRI